MYFDMTKIEKINDFTNNKYKILAHINDEREETLKEHTDLCMKYFKLIFKEKNMNSTFIMLQNIFFNTSSEEEIALFKEMIVNVITFHDIGKINPYFQKDKLKNDLNLKKSYLYKNSRHSLLSAVIYINHFYYKIAAIKTCKHSTLINFMLLNAYVISRHHGELNSLKEFKNKFSISGEGEKLLNDQREVFESTYKDDMKIKSELILKMITKNIKICETEDNETIICRYIYVRFLLSILVACDFYSTTEFMNGFEIENIGTINDIDEFYNTYKSGKIYKSIRKYEKENYNKNNSFSNISDINILRNELFLDAEKGLKNSIDSNIFYLEAPTGSGKSNVATNLSFKLLEDDKEKNKIFYVYPFNTLVEQNISVLKKVFVNEKRIFDKIAVINSIEPIKLEKEERKNEDDKMNMEYYSKALLNRQFLNYPMVLTTHVTIFKYLFGTSKEDIFPLFQLANSVVVLDEIQSYKNLIWGEIITFLTVYAKLLNIKFIIMSATLPNLDSLTLSKGNTVNLIEDRNKYFKNPIFMNRVKVNYELLESSDIYEDLYKHLKVNCSLHKKILIEFITKTSAYDFFNRLKDDSKIKCEVELMTGDDNIVERERILNKVSSCNDIVLVATQVIEAGVDIDMDIGYKNISLLDCEEQFLGRINRSCKKNDSIVYFFKLDEANITYKEDVRKNKDLTLNDESIKKLLAEKEFNTFYKMVIERLMNITGSLNDLNIEKFFKEEVGTLDFAEVENKMELISDDEQGIDVYLSSNLVMSNGDIIAGSEVWKKYKKLLMDNSMNYSEKRVRLSDIKSKMNNFIYKIRWKSDFPYNDRIGELYFIEEGDKYFKDGKLDKEKFISGIGDFI